MSWRHGQRPELLPVVRPADPRHQRPARQRVPRAARAAPLRVAFARAQRARPTSYPARRGADRRRSAPGPAPLRPRHRTLPGQGAADLRARVHHRRADIGTSGAPSTARSAKAGRPPPCGKPPGCSSSAPATSWPSAWSSGKRWPGGPRPATWSSPSPPPAGVRDQVGGLAWTVGSLAAGKKAVDRYLWLVDHAEAVRRERAGAGSDPAPPGAGSAGRRHPAVGSGVPLSGTDQRDALRDVDLHLPAGASSRWSARTGPGSPRW